MPFELLGETKTLTGEAACLYRRGPSPIELMRIIYIFASIIYHKDQPRVGKYNITGYYGVWILSEKPQVQFPTGLSIQNNNNSYVVLCIFLC